MDNAAAVNLSIRREGLKVHHLIILKKVRTDNGSLADLECDASPSRVIVLLK